MVESLISELNLPTRLQEVNVLKEQIKDIAADAIEDLVVASSPKAINKKEDIINLLNQAW